MCTYGNLEPREVESTIGTADDCHSDLLWNYIHLSRFQPVF